MRLLSNERPSDPFAFLGAFFGNATLTPHAPRDKSQKFSAVTFSVSLCPEQTALGMDTNKPTPRSPFNPGESDEEFVSYLCELANSVRRATT